MTDAQIKFIEDMNNSFGMDEIEILCPKCGKDAEYSNTDEELTRHTYVKANVSEMKSIFNTMPLCDCCGAIGKRMMYTETIEN